jgi:tyrosyl-tRNA synthetase
MSNHWNGKIWYAYGTSMTSVATGKYVPVVEELSGLVATKSEARRAVEQGGVTVDGDKMTDIKKLYTKEELGNGLVVRRGKKAFKKIVF